MEKLLISVHEALEITSIGRTRFYELISSGSIKTVKLGKSRLVDYAALKGFVQSLPNDGSPVPTK